MIFCESEVLEIRRIWGKIIFWKLIYIETSLSNENPLDNSIFYNFIIPPIEVHLSKIVNSY